MARYCSAECKAICDFCSNYIDKYRNTELTLPKDRRRTFAGEGICKVDNTPVDASEGYMCPNFDCVNINQK